MRPQAPGTGVYFNNKVEEAVDPMKFRVAYRGAKAWPERAEMLQCALICIRELLEPGAHHGAKCPEPEWRRVV